MVSTPAARPLVVEGLRLVKIVGRGGEGEVWEARDARDRRRALKLVRPDCLASPQETVARGRWLVRIDHPALVRVHRSGLVSGGVLRPAIGRSARRHPKPASAVKDHDLDGWGFVEMDFVAGESLASAAADPLVLERLEPLSEALDLLHAGTWSDGVPLVHRDVKPANIVEDADGRFVLVDPSTLRGLDTDDVTRVGTPLFRAPEVLAGHTTTAADVYSFAATIVALATGLRGRDLANLLRDPGMIDLPRGVRQALSPVPGERPVSCRAVLEQGETMTLPVLPAGQRRSADGEDAQPAGGRETAGAAMDERDADTGDWLAAQDGLLAAEPEEEEPARPGPASGQGWPAPRPAHPEPAGWARSGPEATAHARADRRPPAGSDPRGSGAWLGPAGSRHRPFAGALWTILGVAVLLAPALALGGSALPRERVAFIVLGAAAVHLAAHLAPGRSLLLAVALPPVAWAGLIADRLGGSTRRRAWSRALLVPGFTALAAATPVSALTTPEAVRLVSVDTAVGAELVAVLVPGGVGAVVLGLGAAAVRGGAGVILRPAGLLLWVPGAGVLLALSAIALFPALLIGRGRRLARFAGDTLVSVAEIARTPGSDATPSTVPLSDGR